MSPPSPPRCISEPRGERLALSTRLRSFTERLPPLLRSAVFDFVDRGGVERHDMAWPSIYFLWPSWLHHDLGCRDDAGCREVAYANACLTYAVLIQDRAMDDDASDPNPDMMAASAFLLEGMVSYGSVLPSSSNFWLRCRHLLCESWEHLLVEKLDHGRPSEETLARDDAVQRSKVNWLKVAAVAVAVLAGQEDAAGVLLDHLDHWQSGCQLVDDFEDSLADMAAGNYSRLLVTAGIRGPDPGNLARLERFFGSGALGDYFDAAEAEYRLALRRCPSPRGLVNDHVEALLADLTALRAPYDRLYERARAAASCT